MIAIMGPTASGKTDLAVQLHEVLPVELISVDSALVYREMTIGTAKPEPAVLQKAPHRLIDLCDPAESYSAGQFCEDAVAEIDKIEAQHRIPLLVGGTMLYFRELFFGIAPLPKADITIRKMLDEKLEKQGLLALYEELKNKDPEAAQKIKPQDPQRIQRALEVYFITGKKISDLQKNRSPVISKESVIQIGLMPENRAWLHERIALRFEKMLTDGFIDEVKKLKNRGDLAITMPSMRIVGYRQAWEYLNGDIDFDTMKATAIAATRQLAKRQLTWLRSFENVHLFDPQDPQLFEKVLALLQKELV